MDARAQSALLLAIVTLALAVAMLLRPARSRLFTLFAVLNGNLCAWSIGLFWSSFSGAGLFPLRLALATRLQGLQQDDARAARLARDNAARMEREGSRDAQMDRADALYRRLLART